MLKKALLLSILVTLMGALQAQACIMHIAEHPILTPEYPAETYDANFVAKARIDSLPQRGRHSGTVLYADILASETHPELVGKFVRVRYSGNSCHDPISIGDTGILVGHATDPRYLEIVTVTAFENRLGSGLTRVSKNAYGPD